MRNRHIKVGFTIPLSILEELDKVTTYKGRNRSKFITQAIKERLNGLEASPEMTERQLMAMLLSRTKDPLLMAILQIKLNPNWYDNITKQD